MSPIVVILVVVGMLLALAPVICAISKVIFTYWFDAKFRYSMKLIKVGSEALLSAMDGIESVKESKDDPK